MVDTVVKESSAASAAAETTAHMAVVSVDSHADDEERRQLQQSTGYLRIDDDDGASVQETAYMKDRNARCEDTGIVRINLAADPRVFALLGESATELVTPQLSQLTPRQYWPRRGARCHAYKRRLGHTKALEAA